jgi:hypothetical protein
MAAKKTAVFGIYPERNGAERGVDTLKAAGFRNTDISVLFPEGKGTKDFAHENILKLRKVLQQAREQEQSSVADLAG